MGHQHIIGIAIMKRKIWKIFYDIKDENFPKSMKDTGLHIKETEPN